MQTGVKINFKGVLDRIMPQFCSICGHEGAVLCSLCIKRIPVNGIFHCPVCSRPSLFGVCHDSIRYGCVSSLNGIVSVTRFGNTVVQEMIHLTKYYGIESMGTQMGVIAARLFDNIKEHLPEFDCIVPIPLHKKRFCERGFNQAKSIACPVSDILKVPLNTECIKRVRATRRQVDCIGVERRDNVKGAFVAERAPYSVLLVDDVATTCSTLESVALALREAGSQIVWALTFARG